MRDAALRVVVVQEGVDVEVMLFSSHVAQRRGTDRLLRAAPDEEVAILVGYVVHVRSYVQVLAVLHRSVIRQVATQAYAVVEALLAIALVLKSADGGRDVEVAYPARMRCLRTVVERQARACVLIILVVVVYAYVSAHLGLRLQSRTLRTHVDHAVQGRTTVQHRCRTFHYLHLRYVLQRHVVPVDLTRLGVQYRHTVHQHLATRTYAVGPSAAATYARLLVHYLYARQGLQRTR